MPDKRNSHSRHSNGQSKRLRPGQPAKACKLDNRVQALICRYIREGLAYEVCAGLAGISKQTFFSWKNRGEAEPGSRCGEFTRAVEKANAEAIRTLHNEVKRSDPKFILERRFRDFYAPPRTRTETELTGSIHMETPREYQIIIGLDKDDREALEKWTGLPFREDGFIQFPMCDAKGQPLTPNDAELCEKLARSPLMNGDNRKDQRIS